MRSYPTDAIEICLPLLLLVLLLLLLSLTSSTTSTGTSTARLVLLFLVLCLVSFGFGGCEGPLGRSKSTARGSRRLENNDLEEESEIRS